MSEHYDTRQQCPDCGLLHDTDDEWCDGLSASTCSLSETEQRLIDAEAILGQLSTGYSRFMLNEMHEGQQIGEQVIAYWEKWSGENHSDSGA